MFVQISAEHSANHAAIEELVPDRFEWLVDHIADAGNVQQWARVARIEGRVKELHPLRLILIQFVLLATGTVLVEAKSERKLF